MAKYEIDRARTVKKLTSVGCDPLIAATVMPHRRGADSIDISLLLI